MRDRELDAALACAIDYYWVFVKAFVQALMNDAGLPPVSRRYDRYGHGEAVDAFLDVLEYYGYEIVAIEDDAPPLKAVS